MELVNPYFITPSTDFEYSNERKDTVLLPYTELKSLPTVRVDSYLNILKEKENSILFEEYLKKNYRVVPIVRVSAFTPKPDYPTRVLLEMTSRCNQNCIMCPRQQLKREKKDMEPSLFKKCVDELDNKVIDGLWIYNIGESLLHPNFPELLDYVSSKQHLGPIWSSSNGKELSEHFSRMIIESEMTFMNMSVNAMTSDTYNKISPDSDWNNMVSNFDTFIKIKRCSKKRRPFTRVQVIDQECARHEVDLFISRYAGWADIVATNTLEAFSRDVATNLDYAQKRERPAKKSCRRVKRQDLLIFSNGETTFCDTDFNGTFSMGNVNSNTIFELWNSEFRRNIIELNKTGRLNEVELCRNCLDFDL